MHSKTFFTHFIGNIMTTRREDPKNGSVLFTLTLGNEAHFFVEGNNLIIRQNHQEDLVFFGDNDSPNEAQNLLNTLTEALMRRQKTKLLRRMLFFGLLFLTLLFILGQSLLSKTTIAPLLKSENSGVPFFSKEQQTKKMPMQNPSPALKILANNLREAASRNIFTVPLSTGHARTIYVFSDPLCPHCRDIEPTLEALGKKVNMVIFPVSVIGKQETQTQVIPVLCASTEHRKALWQALFHEPPLTPPSFCDIGEKALSVNNKAFSAYGFTGTPQLISDDGRPIPLSTLQNDETLASFMDHGKKKEK